MGLFDDIDNEVLGTSNNNVNINNSGSLFADIDSEIEAEELERQENNKFSNKHPFIASIPEAGKQFGLRGVKSFPEFGKGLNDLVALIGDKTNLQGLSNFAKSNASYWDSLAEKVPTDTRYQGLKGLKSKETFIPTLFGEIGGQASNIAMAGGGAGAGAKIATQAGLKGLAKGAVTSLGTALPNLAQEGQYLDKIQQFEAINGRLPNEEELRKIQNVALTEKGVNSALETVADMAIFGKLFPQGTLSPNKLKNIGKNMFQQAVTEAGTEGMQEGVSIGAEKLLGINQGNNLERLAESIAIGGLVGGAIGGGATAISQPYDMNFQQAEMPQFAKTIFENSKKTAQDLNNYAKNVSSEIVNRINPANYETTIEMVPQETGVGLSQRTEYVPQVKKVYKNPNAVNNNVETDITPSQATQIVPTQTVNYGNNVSNLPLITDNGTGFVMGESSDLSTIAPKTVAKQQAKANKPLQLTDKIYIDKQSVDNLTKDINNIQFNKSEGNSKPSMALSDNLGRNTNEQEKISKIAPKTVEKQNYKNLSSEQQKQLEEAKQEYEKAKSNITKEQKLSGSAYSDMQKKAKALAMEYSAKKRQIIQGDSLEYVEGGLTAKELEAKKKHAESNYVGKKVYVGGKEAEIVGHYFGKPRVKFANGEVKTVSKEEVKATQPLTNIDEKIQQIAPKTAKKQAKKKIDNSLREDAELIVSTAIEKSFPNLSKKMVKNYLGRVIKNGARSLRGQELSEKIYDEITDKLDDKLVDLYGIPNFPELNYDNEQYVNYSEVMDRAISILKGDYIDQYDYDQRSFEEGEYIENLVEEAEEKIKNAKSDDEAFSVYNNIENELPDKYKNIEEIYTRLLNAIQERAERVGNEQKRIHTEAKTTSQKTSKHAIRGMEENISDFNRASTTRGTNKEKIEEYINSKPTVEEVENYLGKEAKNSKLVGKIAPNISKKQQLKEDVEKAKRQIRNNIFIPDEQKQVLLELLDGEEKEYFVKVAQKIEDTINNAPEMYETDGVNLEDKKPILHYFVGSYDNYVFEIDKETGELFGAVSFNGEDFELGYSSMEELNSLKSRFVGNNVFMPSVELDLYLDPNKTFGEITGNVDKTIENGNSIEKEEVDNETRQESTRDELGDNSINNEKREGREQESIEGMERGRSRNGSNDVGKRFENDNLIPEHKQLIEQKYKNAHELNLAIENFIKNKEYENYDVLPEEVKEWLKKYTGAGGLEKQGATGKGLLSEYYTPKNIVNKMWNLTAQYINTDGAKVLEPSVGIGRFLEFAPDNINADVVEMNPISAKITELLYPNANVEVGEFQQRFVKNNAPVKSVTPEYDIVIGNPPYGAYSGKYKGMGEGKGIERIETYFIKRSLDSLKDNGILTFIVPSSFLDGKVSLVKQQIGQIGELVDAYRLPENTFDTTSIGTDIIVIRKGKTQGKAGLLNAGRWFEQHPEKVLGETLQRRGRYGKEETYVKGDKNAVESIDTSKKDIRETKKTTEKSNKTTVAKTTTKTTKKTTKSEPIKAKVEYSEYKPLLTVSDEELPYFADTQVDGTLPKDKYSPNENVNQYKGKLYNDFNYLQGDIYEKLEQLEYENDISEKQKEIQRKKLNSVLPKPKTVKEISFNPTSNFVKDFIVGEVKHYNYITHKEEIIPRTIVSDFQMYVRKLGREERRNVSVKEIISYTNGEAVRFDYNYPPGMYDKKERERYAKQQRPKLFAKLKRVSEELFNNYISEKLDVEHQKELTEMWNRAYNNLYTPDYYNMPLLVKGLKDTFYGKKLKLNKLQEKGINFLTNKGIGLLGFEVGTGKTLAGIISTVQNMQMGRCKRPLILVPKQVKDNWIREIGETFPNIKVNDIGNLSKFNGTIEDNTVSVGTYEALSNIWYEKEVVEQMKDEMFSVSKRQDKENYTLRKEETDKNKAEEMIGKAQKNNKELYKLSELGFDHITVDEAHNFKNLFNKAETGGKEEEGNKGNSYGGIQVQGGDSQRASRLFLLVQQILKNNDNRNVFMLTATPFSNNPLEVFNMLSYLSKDSLEKAGLYNAYQFMETYADTDADWAVNISNDVVMKNQVKAFKNAGSLREIIKNVILMGSADEVGIERPEKYTTSIQLEPSKKQLELIREAEEELMENKTENGAIFKALHKSRMATLSPDIAKGNINVTPEEFIKNSPKLHYIMEAVEAMKKKDPNTSQLIYMPMGVNYLPKIKKYLVDKGVFKADEIEVITSEVKEDKIPDITDSFNDRKNGKVKLIIGTQKIKEGMNLNKNSSVLYIPQLDWNPTDFVQVVGRIWRQGNRYGKVRVVVPLLKNSSDPFMFQKLSEKTSRLNDLMSDEAGDYIDSGELNTEEERLNMITLPDKKAKMYTVVENEKINNDIADLRGKLDTVQRIQDELQGSKQSLEYNQKELKYNQEQIEQVDKETEEYRYNMYSSRISEAKKNIAKYKGQVERLEKTIKDREFDFEGKDSIENIEAEIKKLEERKEKLKEIELQKLEEYTKEYNKNQTKAKSIEESIIDFDNQTDELYNGKYPNDDVYYSFSNIDIPDFLKRINNEKKDYKFFLKNKDIVYDGRKVATLGELRKHPSFEIVNDLFDEADDNIEIRLLEKEQIEKHKEKGFKLVAYYNPKKNSIHISEDFSIENIVHEYTHALDERINKNNFFYFLENLKYKKLKKDTRDRDIVYNEYIEFIKERFAFENEQVAIERLQTNEKRSKFRIPTKRTSTFMGRISESRWTRTRRESSKENVRANQNIAKSKTRKINGRFRSTTTRNNNKTFRGIDDNYYSLSKEQGIDYSKYNQKAKDYIREWYSDIEKNRYDVNKTLNSFINITKAIAKEYSKNFGMKINDKQIREILPFLRERTGLPERLERPDLKAIFDKLNGKEKERLTKLADDTSAKFEKYYKEYQEAKGVENTSDIENHISHIWDLDKKQKSLLTNYFTTSSRFAKNRTIDTLVKGIDGFEVNGETIYFKPKTLDYAEILKSSSDSFIKATSDMILADRVKNMEAKNGKGQKGQKLVLPAHKAPADWVEFNHPALNKSVYMGGNADVSIIGKRPVKVHPELAKTLKTVFETPAISNAFLNVFDKANSVYKQSQLGFSGFHMVALSESMLGNIGITETVKLLNPIRMYDEIAKGNWGIYKDDTIAKQAIEDGLQLGATLDLDRGTVEKIADDVTSFVEKIPVVGKFFKFIPKTLGKVQRLNNQVLWDYLHNNYKLECYKLYATQEAERLGRALTKAERREIAQWVNDSFGGQVWENLGIAPSQRRTEQRILLSPDWLRSTTRQFLAMLSTEKGAKFLNEKSKENAFWKKAKEIAEEWGINSNTEDIEASSLRGRISKAFWLRALIYSAILYNLMNAFFRYRDKEEYPQYYPKKMTIKDYSLLGNSKGSKTFVFIGRNSDGTERYLRLGKQFREMPEMLEKPLEKLGGKASPMIQIGSQILTGHTASGFKNKNFYGDTYATKDVMKKGWERVGESAKLVGTSLAPFSLNSVFNPYMDTTAWSLFAPVGKGMTKYKGKSAFVEAYKKDNKNEIEEIRQSLKRNGFDRKEINKIEKSAITEFSKPYVDKYEEALIKQDQKKVLKIRDSLNKTNLSAYDKRKIYSKALDEYMKNRK